MYEKMSMQSCQSKGRKPQSTGWAQPCVVELHLPQYLELRKAVLIAGPNDRAVLEGRGLQTPLGIGMLIWKAQQGRGNKRLCA